MAAQDGPGTLEHRLDFVQSARRHDRPLQHPLGSGRADAAGARARVERSRVPLGQRRRVLQGLHARGIEPLVTLYGTPAWANGGRKPNVAPTSSTTFADFAYAAAKRYPFVRKWTIWNEPNQRLSLARTSPSLYVKRLLNPAYAAIHRANRRALVAGGVTAPRGNTGGYGPLAWVRGMAAGAREARRVRAQPVPDAPARVAVPRRVPVLRRDLDGEPEPAVKRGAPRPRQQADLADRVRLPDEPAGSASACSPSAQAQYVGESALRAYQLPGVTMLIQFLVRDEPHLGALPERALHRARRRQAGVLARSAFRSRRSRGAARARRSGDRSGRARARARTGCRSANERQRGAGSGSTQQTNGGGFFSQTVDGAARRARPRLVAAAALLRLAAARSLARIARREGRHPRRRDGYPAPSADADHEQAPAADRRPADGQLTRSRRSSAPAITELMLVTGGTHAGEFLRLLGNGHEYGIDRLVYALPGAGGRDRGGARPRRALRRRRPGLRDARRQRLRALDQARRSRTSSGRSAARASCSRARADVEHLRHLGVPEFDGDGRVKRIVEKPDDAAERVRRDRASTSTTPTFST